MVHGVSTLLISAAAGYWVSTQASKEKGQMKKLGQVLGLIIIVASLAGVACKVYYLASACRSGGMMAGKMTCPFPGKSAPPATGQ